MHKWKYFIVFMGMIGLILIIGFSSHSYGSNTTTFNNSTGSFINSSSRVLIVAPHPADETIGAGGIISYCVEHNIPMKVIVMTDGNTGDDIDITVERHNESVMK